MLSRVAVVVAVAVLAVLACGVSATNQIIYDDYTSGQTFILPKPVGNPGTAPGDYDTQYSTYKPGCFSFGLYWNNDASDQFSYASTGGTVTITPLNSLGVAPAGCTPNTAGVTLTSALPVCNYTACWNTAFSGLLSITYNNGVQSSPDQVASQQITVAFTSAQVVGDPQFVGLRGQSYQVHGLDGAVYNIITEADTQVNARFVFLTQGECPVLNGVADSNCWSHPGSYLGEMSFQAVVDGKLHAALLTAGSAKQGFSGVQMDGKAVRVGQTVSFGAFSLTVQDSYTVHITTAHFEFELSNSDMFINQALRATVPLSALSAHGLLGQTHATTIYPTSLKYIDGSVDDYVIADSDIFGSDFVYNMFQQ